VLKKQSRPYATSQDCFIFLEQLGHDALEGHDSGGNCACDYTNHDDFHIFVTTFIAKP